MPLVRYRALTYTLETVTDLQGNIRLFCANNVEFDILFEIRGKGLRVA